MFSSGRFVTDLLYGHNIISLHRKEFILILYPLTAGHTVQDRGGAAERGQPFSRASTRRYLLFRVTAAPRAAPLTAQKIYAPPR